MKPCKSKQPRYQVFPLEPIANSYTRILLRVPEYVQLVTGIYVSIGHTSPLSGELSLRFSEGNSSPILRQQVSSINAYPFHKIEYAPLSEPISPACIVMGYYHDKSGHSFVPYRLNIYLRFEPK